MCANIVTVTAIKKLPVNNLCIWFTMPQNIAYTPGQYITFILNINGKELRRPYSIGNFNTDTNTAMVLVKLIDNGEVSRYLYQHLKINDQITILPPNGRFVLPEKRIEQLYFFAAGSGIAPILALIKHAFTKQHIQVTLVYSNKSMGHTVFYDELIALQQAYANNFNIIWLWSDAKNLAYARLNRFMLQDMLMKNNTEWTNPNILYYMCGPFVYMEMIWITLLTLGINANCLYKEIFTTGDDEDDDEGSLLTDKELPTFVDAQVTIHTKTETHLLTVRHDQTILQAAIENNITLPYSCASGMCSSCVCSITQGKVYLHYNQVLTYNDIKQGRTLTCTAHPISNSIELNYNN